MRQHLCSWRVFLGTDSRDGLKDNNGLVYDLHKEHVQLGQCDGMTHILRVETVKINRLLRSSFAQKSSF